MSLAGSHSIEKLRYYREADQIVRQLEQDQDEDGFMFYQEQEDGTSDRDPDDNPDTKKESEPQAKEATINWFLKSRERMFPCFFYSSILNHETVGLGFPR